MISSKPLVSIGVPTYNRPVELRRTLECLVKQTYSNIEIVISDNCSTSADVEEVVNEFLSDERIKYFKQSINKGAPYNFTFVLDKSTGEYFKFLADDDWIDYNYVERCMAFLLENPAYSIAYGIGNLCSLNGEFIKLDPKMDIEFDDADKRVKYYYENVLNNSPFYGVFKRNQVLQYFSFENLIAIDWVVIARFVFLNKCKLISETNSFISTGGISSNIETMCVNFKMPLFTRVFPYLQISINVFKDILWVSPVYRTYNFFKRFALAKACFFITYKKHNVGKQLWPGTKKLIKVKLGLIKM